MVLFVNSIVITFLLLLILYRFNGKTIFVNINENFTEAKLIKQGSQITVKHSGVNIYGTLLYPKFYRERLDVHIN